MSWKLDPAKYSNRMAGAMLYGEAGKVTQSLGLIYEAHLPGASVGSLCEILSSPENPSAEGVAAEVIGFREKRVLLMPFEDVPGVNHDSLVILRQRVSTVSVGEGLLGRVLDGRGRSMDAKGPVEAGAGFEQRGLYQKPSDPLRRVMITQPLDLGIRSINGLLTSGKGQRVGIFAGSGVGKSVLLGMMARNTSADVNVIALVGERAREVREFIERDLGPAGLARSVVVVATSEASPLIRMRAAFLAATVAEYFRDQGKDVLLLMDSLTRFCMAQREISLSMGEPPASKGYTPSVFSTMPKLLERCGTTPGKGSITGFFTVLVEGDDMDEPIADAARSVLDGHIVLSRRLAERGHYPAVDVMQSVSRVMVSVVDAEHRRWAEQIREWMAIYAQVEDLIQIGAYVRGTHAKTDQAIAMVERITQFLRQGIEETARYTDTLSAMQAIIRAGDAFLAGAERERNPQAAPAPSRVAGIRF